MSKVQKYEGFKFAINTHEGDIESIPLSHRSLPRLNENRTSKRARIRMLLVNRDALVYDNVNAVLCSSGMMTERDGIA